MSRRYDISRLAQQLPLGEVASAMVCTGANMSLSVENDCSAASLQNKSSYINQRGKNLKKLNMKKLITLLVAAMLSVLSAMGAVQLQHNGKTYTMSPTIKGSSVYAVAIDGYNTKNGTYIIDNDQKYGLESYNLNYGEAWAQLSDTDHAIYIKNNGADIQETCIVEYNASNHQARALQKQTVQIVGGTQGQWDNYTTLTFTDGCYQADFTATATYYFRYKYNNTEYQPYVANFDASSQDKYYSANAGGSSYAFYIQPGSYKICVSADGKNVFVVKQNAKTGYYVFGNINDVDNWSDTNAAQRITLKMVITASITPTSSQTKRHISVMCGTAPRNVPITTARTISSRRKSRQKPPTAIRERSGCSAASTTRYISPAPLCVSPSTAQVPRLSTLTLPVNSTARHGATTTASL